MRVFIAITLPEKVKKEVSKIQNSLPEFNGKKTEYENLHLTLKFIGEADEKMVKEVMNRLGRIKFGGFETEMGEVGFFDNPERGIVWIHLTNCDELQKEVDKALRELFEPERRFMGHLTIARVRGVKDKKEFLKRLSEIKVPKTGFEVNKISFMESKLSPKGPVYSVIKEFNLK